MPSLLAGGHADWLSILYAVHYTVSLANSGDVVFDSRTENRSGNQPAIVIAGRSELHAFFRAELWLCQQHRPYRYLQRNMSINTSLNVDLPCMRSLGAAGQGPQSGRRHHAQGRALPAERRARVRVRSDRWDGATVKPALPSTHAIAL